MNCNYDKVLNYLIISLLSHHYSYNYHRLLANTNFYLTVFGETPYICRLASDSTNTK